MYAAGTGGLASSGGVIPRLAGTSSRCQKSRSQAATVAMTRPTGDNRLTCGMVSASRGIGDGARQRWPVTVTGVVATRSRGSLATPLLRNEEVSLHPLQLWHLRIAIAICPGIPGEHETSVATGNRARCSELHGVRRRGHGPGRVANGGPPAQLSKGRLVVKDDTQQRAVHLQPAVVFDQPELAELVHEEVHP